ncbi:MAG: hypothetical protein Ta2E_03900 [Mycoplasmoidaceae bacterium]|nr:MAG: hypothetical protein Ta2E_03900 [Mycoplasmoidaceae bacterium]
MKLGVKVCLWIIGIAAFASAVIVPIALLRNKPVPGMGRLTLDDDKKIIIKEQIEFDLICTADAATTEITIDSITFKKENVVKFEFGKEYNPIDNWTLQDNFLSNFINIKNKISVPKKVHVIGNGFLSGVSKYNFNLSLHSQIFAINDDFLKDCESFNRPLYFNEKLETLGKNFMSGCISFDSRLFFRADLKIIEDDFLKNCKSFNRIFDLPQGMKKIRPGFMSGCNNFNFELLFPDTLTEIADDFLYECNSLTAAINFQNIQASIFSGTNSFSTTNENATCYTSGFVIKGKYANDIHTKFADSSASPFRKIKVVS